MKLFKLTHLSLFLTLILSSSTFAQNTTEINALTSEATTTRPDTGNVVPTPQEDAIITNSIQSLYKNSKTLQKLDVGVKTEKGMVTVTGTVDSDSQASSLVELAQSVIGVKNVEASGLAVKDSTQPLADMLITAKIKGLFIREKVFGDKDIASLNISVETKNGVVYLTGAIDNQDQIKNAIKIIEGVNGVKKVEYHVKKVTVTGKDS